jgi:hypothetical protein
MSIPGNFDIQLYRGDNDRISMQFLEDDANRTPVDLTGSVVILTAKYSRKDAHPAILLEANFPSPTTGDFAFDILPSHTEAVPVSDKPLSLFYDIQYRHGDITITIVTGLLVVLPEVGL